MRARKVLALVNGAEGSAADVRARALSAHLSASWKLQFVHRGPDKRRAIVSMFEAAQANAPDLIWVIDTAYSGVLAATMARVRSGTPFVLDTGDAITELGRSLGRSRVARTATWGLEELALHSAAHIVVRGSVHRKMLEARRLPVTFIPDGVDTARFRPQDSKEAKRRFGLRSSLVVGVLGSLTWNAQHAFTYGWELVETLARLPDLDVTGLLVGDGDGRERIEERARALGVRERLICTGRLPFDELPAAIAAMDVCISTQSNDVAGSVRTTGKLPLYMAMGRYVLASDVGEATRVLPPEMRLPYSGVRDDAWPERLANAIRRLATHPEELDAGARNRQRAQEEFEYSRLAERLAAVFERITS